MGIRFIVVLQARLILTQSIEAAIAIFVDILWLSEGFLFYKGERTERLLVCVPSRSLAATHRGSTATPPGPRRDRGLFVDANDVISLPRVGRQCSVAEQTRVRHAAEPLLPPLCDIIICCLLLCRRRDIIIYLVPLYRCCAQPAGRLPTPAPPLTMFVVLLQASCCSPAATII